jgi:thiamine-phosphate pyrophosphorylase
LNFSREQLLLYAITDRRWSDKQSFLFQIEEALRGGITMLQLREKNLSTDDYIELAKKVEALVSKYNVPFIVNDSLEAALLSGADGVHMGQVDNIPSDIRDKVGTDKILGLSAGSVREALKAEELGADYIGVGSVFNTSTKGDAKRVELSLLRKISASVSIPIVAIGGINENNISELEGSGISGVSIISGIFAQEDVFSAAVRFKTLAEKIILKKPEGIL